MVKVNLQDLKKLRNETSASIADCRLALEESDGDYKKALLFLKKRGIEKAEKKQDRTTSQGLIEYYIHQNGKVGSMIEILCETDFVARTDEFKKLAHEVAMQVCAMNPKDINALLKQEYIRDSSITMENLIKSVIGKLGENIKIGKIVRFEI
ncbi:MAG: translation elongation factor Ts [Candidatus Levybacteria bacterium RBG_16_35_6]|nr:MAG: translation elongation factor Ts [Candidatus Levybacteria bacterium RBG_16_35_6]